MNGYEKAQALGLTGTDAEIVAVLKTLTVSDIPVKSLARLLREEGLLLWTGEKYIGSIQVLVTASGTPQQFIDGIDELKSAVIGGSAETLLTTVPFWAGKVWAIISAIIALIPDTEGIVEKVYALDGGRPYKDLTDVQFAAQRTAALAKAEIQPIWTARAAVVAEGIHAGTITTIEQIVAVIGGK
jgi:hypothetical protein